MWTGKNGFENFLICEDIREKTSVREVVDFADNVFFFSLFCSCLPIVPAWNIFPAVIRLCQFVSKIWNWKIYNLW